MTVSTDMTVERAEELIRRMTDGLVTITDTTGEFLLKLDDGSIIDTKGWNGWEWTHGVALTGLYHAAEHSLQTAMGWFDSQYAITRGKGAPKNINTAAPFYSLCALLADGHIKDKRWEEWCDEWAAWLMSPDGLPKTREGGFQHMTYLSEHDGQLWDDTLMMSVIPLARIGVWRNNKQYVEEAKYQFLLHAQYLCDTTTGLWFHGWQFNPEGGGHNFARALWARGNSWITVAIPLFLEILGPLLPSTDPVYRFLVATLRRQVDALLACQDESGLWHTLLVDNSSYLESSASAGFAAGIYAALRMGLLEGDKYRDAADRALKAVVGCIREDGQLDKVSFGTGMGPDLQFYKDIPVTPMPYGQALAMLALVEWERLNGKEKS